MRKPVNHTFMKDWVNPGWVITYSNWPEAVNFFFFYHFLRGNRLTFVWIKPVIECLYFQHMEYSSPAFMQFLFSYIFYKLILYSILSVFYWAHFIILSIKHNKAKNAATSAEPLLKSDYHDNIIKCSKMFLA